MSQRRRLSNLSSTRILELTRICEEEDGGGEEEWFCDVTLPSLI